MRVTDKELLIEELEERLLFDMSIRPINPLDGIPMMYFCFQWTELMCTGGAIDTLKYWCWKHIEPEIERMQKLP